LSGRLLLVHLTDPESTLIYTLSLHDALPISSVPVQNPSDPFTVPDYTSPGGFDPRRPDTRLTAAPPETGATTNVLPRALEAGQRSEEHTSELQSRSELVCRLLLETKNTSASS